jgi:hypothetical protein
MISVGISTTAQIASFINECQPLPSAKNANRQLSCNSRPVSTIPRATKAAPGWPPTTSPASTQQAPVTTPTTTAIPDDRETAALHADRRTAL